MRDGYLIVLEGADGAGTTTQIKKIVPEMFHMSKYNRVLMTREPSGNYSKAIRDILGDGTKPITETGPQLLELFVGARYEHHEEDIGPALERGIHVVSDRERLSTFVYQGLLQGMSLDDIAEMHDDLPRVPDLVMVLDVDPEVAIERAAADAESRGDNFDKPENVRRLCEGYRLIIPYMQRLIEEGKVTDHKIVVINGNMPIQEVTDTCMKHVAELLGQEYLPRPVKDPLVEAKELVARMDPMLAVYVKEELNKP